MKTEPLKAGAPKAGKRVPSDGKAIKMEPLNAEKLREKAASPEKRADEKMAPRPDRKACGRPGLPKCP